MIFMLMILHVMAPILSDLIYPYNFQSDLNIDGQVIFTGEMVCEGNFFSMNINSNYDVSPKNKPNNTILYLR